MENQQNETEAVDGEATETDERTLDVMVAQYQGLRANVEPLRQALIKIVDGQFNPQTDTVGLFIQLATHAIAMQEMHDRSMEIHDERASNLEDGMTDVSDQLSELLDEAGVVLTAGDTEALKAHLQDLRAAVKIDAGPELDIDEARAKTLEGWTARCTVLIERIEAILNRNALAKEPEAALEVSDDTTDVELEG